MLITDMVHVLLTICNAPYVDGFLVVVLAADECDWMRMTFLF
jgi:hypothetical protein